VFLDKPEIKKVIGDCGTYLGVTIKSSDFLKALGINTELTVEAALKQLRVLVAAKNTEKPNYERIYRFLDKHFDSDAEAISDEFSKCALIYVPGSSQLYYSAVEVKWRDESEVCGVEYGYLESHYPRLSSFFLESLQVDERASPRDHADFLERLTERESISEADEKSIVRSYEALNRGLNPAESEPLISEELWWSSFVTSAIFWTHHGEFWMNEVMSSSPMMPNCTTSSRVRSL